MRSAMIMFGTTWKTLVAYQKVVSGKEEVGIERALGSAFFYRGGFTDHEKYLEYIRKINTFAYAYRSAQNYSPSVRPISDLAMRKAGRNVIQNVQYYQDIIKNRNTSNVSMNDAIPYFDNMTLFIDTLLDIQNSLANDILEILDESFRRGTGNIILGSVLVFIIVLLCPVQIQVVYKQTGDIQSYALTLVDKTRELNKEKKRTDSLLYQMLPQSVADKLKNNKSVNAEYFKDVTILFSNVDEFSRLASDCTPMQIVELLAEMYTMFDAIIDMHNVYKVETIGDQYMVASGVPTKNRTRHATEIANVSLELLAATMNASSTVIPGIRIRLKVGIHSGPVMAGVVGAKMPRYCLFGDTVNTASRMESTGAADRIHISSSTHKILLKRGEYMCSCRGPVDIKGKGQMITYWLTGCINPHRYASKCYSIDSSVVDRSSTQDSVRTERSSTYGSTMTDRWATRDSGVISTIMEAENDGLNEVVEILPTTSGTAGQSSPRDIASFPGTSEKDLKDQANQKKWRHNQITDLPGVPSTSKGAGGEITDSVVAIEDMETRDTSQYRSLASLNKEPPAIDQLPAAWAEADKPMINMPLVEGYHF